MANETNSPGTTRPGGPTPKTNRSSQQPDDRPSARLLITVFLLGALIITAVAYIRGESAEFQAEQTSILATAHASRRSHRQELYRNQIKLGLQAEQRDEYDSAITHFKSALLVKDEADGHLYLGDALLKRQKPDEAFAEYAEALRLNPKQMNVYTTWGNALLAQGKLDDALKVFQQALDQNPNYAPAHYNIGLVLVSQETTADTGRRDSEKANQNQKSADFGAQAVRLGQQALEQFAAADKLGLNTAAFYSAYGAELNQGQKFAEAETFLVKAVSADPSLAEAHFQLGIACDHQGKYADAIEHYEAMLALSPNNPQALNNLALLYATATNLDVRSPDMGILLATRACEATAYQTARFVDTLARSYAAKGDFFQAITWEDKAIHRATLLIDHDLLREFNPRQEHFQQHQIQ